MTHRSIAAAIGLILLPLAASAQTHQPYAGLETREIKALSAEQLAELRDGRGMGLALAAELNGYPGPAHVLELAGPLGLSPKQREDIARLVAAMKAEAKATGEKLIAAEGALDRQFATRSVTEASLRAGVEAIAAEQAALRAGHLKYHLATVAVLSPEQIAHYDVLRGYKGGAAGGITGSAPKTHRH